MEGLACRAGCDFDAFYAAREHGTAEADDVLVISCDGKGIVMRPDALRPATRKQAAKANGKLKTRLSKGETRNRKRIAEVCAVYDASPVPRAVADVLPAGESERRDAKQAPQARGKWLTASVTDDAAQVVGDIFDEAERRDPDHARPPGRARRWRQPPDRPDRGRSDRTRDRRHDPRRPRARARVPVEGRLELSPRGRPRRRGVGPPPRAADPSRRRHQGRRGDPPRATKGGLDPPRRAGADACATYLTNKAAHLDYPTALTNGWPIATGVIEGACRHLVKDRMDLTGARWGLDGAEAILGLRAIRANGDFDEYWRYHLNQEHQRVHRTRYADNALPHST